MATKRLVLGEWLPDQPGLTGALMEAKNVIPVLNGYGALPSAKVFSDTASENLLAVVSGKYSDTIQLFAAGATKIFKFDPNDLDLDDVSKSGGYSNATMWKFTQFGRVLIGANGNDKLQAWSVGVSSAWADLDSTAPIARFVTVVRDFVVAARNSSNPNRVYWSDINDETNWTSGTTSQSDFQDIPDGGNIQGITGGEFGIVLLEKAIYRMSYIGSPLFFQFDAISRNLGCYEPNSIVQQGGRTFFLSDDGFYVTDGQTITPIGAEKVNRWFFDDVNEGQLDKMSAAVDPERQIVAWCYPNSNAGKSLLAYNWQTGKWSYGIVTTDYIANVTTVGTTLEQLDIYGNLESVPASLDSRLWAGGKPLFSGVRGDEIILFGGDPMTPQLITGDFEDGMQSIVKMAYPQVDGGSADIAVASRVRLDAAIEFGDDSSADSENRVSLRSVGRYHRLRVKPTGEWKTIMAVDIETQPVGNR